MPPSSYPSKDCSLYNIFPAPKAEVSLQVLDPEVTALEKYGIFIR
jgi:hypothetical protein